MMTETESYKPTEWSHVTIMHTTGCTVGNLVVIYSHQCLVLCLMVGAMACPENSRRILTELVTREFQCPSTVDDEG